MSTDRSDSAGAGSAGKPHADAPEKSDARLVGIEAAARPIDIRLAVDPGLTDEEIARTVVQRLAWEVAIPLGAVKVTVDKGWVTLSGELVSNFQRDVAERPTRNLAGVTGLSNKTTVAGAAG